MCELFLPTGRMYVQYLFSFYFCFSLHQLSGELSGSLAATVSLSKFFCWKLLLIMKWIIGVRMNQNNNIAGQKTKQNAEDGKTPYSA